MNLSNRLIRLGTPYGGWHIPLSFLLDSPKIAICVGAGEDISYDLILSGFYEAVFILDPTPRACEHWSSVIHCLLENRSSYSKPDNYDYSTIHYRLNNLHFHPLGLYSYNGTLNFFPPANCEHSSFSTENLQNTTNPILLPVIDALALSVLIGSNKPDILKLDIEGAEIPFIKFMLTTCFRPRLLQIEFDSFLISISTAEETIMDLVKFGYKLIHRENRNFLFLYS